MSETPAPDTAPARNEPSSHVDRIRVDAARARTGGAVARNGETFTACAAPDHVLVVGADASLSGCEFAASPAIAGDEIPEPFAVGAEGAGDRVRAAFASESFASLRTSLRQGLLPLRTCSRCARSLLSFRGDTAPCVRDYGSLLASAEPSPRRLVLMVPARGTPFAAALLASLPDLLTTVETVVLHGDDVLGHDGVGAVLDLVRAARPSNGGNAPRLALRTVHLAFDDAVKAQLEGQALASIEVLAEPASLSALAAAVALAEATSAAATATMTLAPASWFAIDEVARECDRLALPLTVRVSGHDGAPMARVDADGLQFAAKAFSALAAADSSQRPVALSSENLIAVASDLRSLLRRDADPAGDDAAPNEPAVALPMPTPEHAWLASESTWFVRHLMAEHRSRSLRNWLVGQADRSDFAAALAEVPWLRVLTQAVFASAKAGTCAALADGLRAVYGDSKQRARLATADDAVATRLDLAAVGGPWARRLGVHERPARKRPFAAGRVRSAKVAAEPEITFVVPFAGRGDDLAETVRSLQTQPSGRFLALVLIAYAAPIPAEVPAKDTRVRVEVAPPGVDPDAHLRAVLSAVATPFVAVLNAGDVLHQERVAQCLAEFAADPRVQVVATGRALLDQDGLEITAANASRLLDGDEAVALAQSRSGAAPELEGPFSDFVSWLSKDRLGTLGSCVFRREVFERSAATTALRSAGAGWELALPVAAAGAFRLLDTVSIASRIAKNAPSSQPEREAAVARIAAQFDGEVARWLGTSVAVGDDAATAGQPATSATIEALREALIERDVLCVEAHATAAARALADADKARLARKIQELERSIAGMAQKVARVDDLERRQGTMLSDRSDQETRIGKLREDKTLLRADIDEVRRDRESLRTDLAALRTDLAAVHQDQEGLRATLQALREERAVLDSTIARLYSDLANLERVRKETEERRAAMTVLRDEQQELVRVRSEQLAHEHAQLEQRTREWTELTRELAERTRELAERTADRDGQSALRAALEAELATTRARVEAADSKLEAAAVQLADTEVSLQTTTAQRDALQSELDQRASELQARTFERDVLATAHTRMLSHNQALQDQNKKLAERAALLDLSLADTKAALAHESKRLADLEVERLRLHSVRESLQRGMASLRQELDRVRHTREFRVGNLLWNKLPLGYVSRRLKKWLRRLRDARTRFALRFSSPRAAAGGESLGRAIVAATRQWPIYSHTFVYQEMTSLREAGLDVTLFHWDHGKKSHLHDAFRALGDRSVQLQPIVEIHRRDKRYFERTRPGRLRAFLERVAAATGRTVESLEEEPLVLQGCTFARMAELAKVRYFHSYFFYDQSFLTMQAAFLLDVPRGISCYADHMLDDYPWKLVPLHLELASVVVATSQRIRKELSEKGGGRFDDKLLVKPNGVDGARWPVIERSPRTGTGRFAVVSLSRIEPKKGLVHLVEAVAILRGKGLDVVAHVIGAVDPEIPASLVAGEELERRIAEKGLRDHVILHGMKLQEQIRPILAEARAFVAPYVELPTGDKDGIPTAMLEAMSTGLPVVATDAASIREVLDDGVQGFLVKQGDGKALAAAIERLVLEPETEQRMAKAARARFAERFDVRKTEPILHDRVRALLAASRPGGAVPIGPARGEGKDGRPERKDGAASSKSGDGRTRAAR